MAFWRRRAKDKPGDERNNLAGVPTWQLEDMFKKAILKQIEDVRHLALITGLLMLKRTSPERDETDDAEYSQLHDALSRFRGEPELEPLRQAAINELKRRADEEGDTECAKILERAGFG